MHRSKFSWWALLLHCVKISVFTLDYPNCGGGCCDSLDPAGSNKSCKVLWMGRDEPRSFYGPWTPTALRRGRCWQRKYKLALLRIYLLNKQKLQSRKILFRNLRSMILELHMCMWGWDGRTVKYKKCQHTTSSWGPTQLSVSVSLLS